MDRLGNEAARRVEQPRIRGFTAYARLAERECAAFRQAATGCSSASTHGVRVDLDARHPETRVKQIEIEGDVKQRSERSERSESAVIQIVQGLTSGLPERCANASQSFPNATASDPNGAQNGGVCVEAAQTLAPNEANAPNGVLAPLGEWQEEL